MQINTNISPTAQLTPKALSTAGNWPGRSVAVLGSISPLIALVSLVVAITLFKLAQYIYSRSDEIKMYLIKRAMNITARKKSPDETQRENELNLAASLYSEKKFDLAFKQYKILADKGIPQGLYWVGRMYHDGTGVSQSLEHAIDYYRSAAEKKYSGACFALGELYYEGVEGFQSFEAAISYYELSLPNPKARYMLGICHYYGLGTAQSFEKAYASFLPCASQPHALCMLGDMHLYGQHVEKSQALAKDYYVQAASKQDPETNYEYGYRYQTGKEIEKNELAAAIFYKFAADQGSAQAMYALGLLYHAGKGVEKDAQKAMKLIQEGQNKDTPRLNLPLAKSFIKHTPKKLIDTFKWL